MSVKNQVKCPNCGTDIDVNDILSHQLEDKFKQQFNAQLAEQRIEFEKKQETLSQEKIDFDARHLQQA